MPDYFFRETVKASITAPSMAGRDEQPPPPPELPNLLGTSLEIGAGVGEGLSAAFITSSSDFASVPLLLVADTFTV